LRKWHPLLERIRSDKKLKNQKVMFLTVVSLSQAGKKVIDALKPIDYIEKPIDVPQLKKRIAKILG
jgi:response regulator RpfG family c-di-GMP phosphodiesterase